MPANVPIDRRAAVLSGLAVVAALLLAVVGSGNLRWFDAARRRSPSLPSNPLRSYLHTPMLLASSPRNSLVGHAIGAVYGYLALVIFGLTNIAPALVEGVAWNRVGAAALSLGSLPDVPTGTFASSYR